MGVILLALALVSGLLTCVFIVSGLRHSLTRHKTLGVRALALTTIFSALTGVFTIWQLVLATQQIHIP